MFFPSSLVQIIGRATRNAAGKVIMYADRMSEAMEKAIAEILTRHVEETDNAAASTVEVLKNSCNVLIPAQRKQLIKALESEMLEHAKKLEFEQAAAIRDEIAKIKEMG